ncbi:hypothetical protein GCM10022270_15880 [Terriglobus aquaticus]
MVRFILMKFSIRETLRTSISTIAAWVRLEDCDAFRPVVQQEPVADGRPFVFGLGWQKHILQPSSGAHVRAACSAVHGTPETGQQWAQRRSPRIDASRAGR